HCLDISPDGSTIAFGDENEAENILTINLCDLRTGKKINSFTKRHWSGNVFPIRFAPDGKTVALSPTGTLIRLDYASGKVRQSSIKANVAPALAFSPDGGVLAIAGNADVQLWDVNSSKLIRRTAHTGGWAGAVCFTRDGKSLAVGTDKLIYLY